VGQLPSSFLWLIPVCASVAALAQQSAPVAPSARRAPRALTEFSAAVSDLAEGASHAVVQVSLRVRLPVDSDDKRRSGFVAEQRASGSGVVVDPQGFIVTNAHVIEGARKIDVSVLEPGQQGPSGKHRHYDAKVVGMDKETDLAVLKIDAHDLQVLSFADSSELKQGQIVLAMGSPLGLDNSLTVGFVSAAHRHLDDQEPMYYIQTDAPINPGNSGGPLLDTAGRIVGINTMIMSRSGGSEGIGFAIPSDIVTRVTRLLKADGSIRRGAIGVVSEDITPLLAAALGLDREVGVILSDVAPHSAAEAAGLQPGDIVLSIDGQKVEAAHELIGLIFAKAVGDEVTLELARGSERLKKKVTVMERSSSRGGLMDLAARATLIRQLGILALTVDERVNSVLPDLRRLYGVAIAAIPEEYAASNPGLAAGDIIYEVNGRKVETIEVLQSSLAAMKAGAPMALLVERDGRLIFVTFEFE
jgi:serine protease Do